MIYSFYKTNYDRASLYLLKIKIKSVLYALLLTALCTACTQYEEMDEFSGNSEEVSAFVSIAVDTNQDNNTRDTGPTEEDGFPIESSVKYFRLITFDKYNNILGWHYSRDQVKSTFKINANTKRIFIMANMGIGYDQTMATRLINYTVFNAPLQMIKMSDATNNFLMCNAGRVPNDKGLIEIEPILAKSESKEDIEAARAEAMATPLTLKVNRAFAKINLVNEFLTPFPPDKVENGNVILYLWAANTTNNTLLPYSELVEYEVPQPHQPAQYRIDNNWERLTMKLSDDKKSIVGDAVTQFKWIHNYDSSIYWAQKNNYYYISENTMSVDAQDYNNTTKMLINAQFMPPGFRQNESWFRMKGIVYNFSQLMSLYQNSSTPQSVKDGLDKFYREMMAHAATPPTGTVSFANATLQSLDAIEKGGYIAATIDPYLIEYYQNGLCYYEILIKHDNRVAPFGLGRWGVVRNNRYYVNITRITKPGLPYIPDPTDIKIKDPANPDPFNPKRNDQINSSIETEISVLPWEPWIQDTEI